MERDYESNSEGEEIVAQKKRNEDSESDSDSDCETESGTDTDSYLDDDVQPFPFNNGFILEKKYILLFKIGEGNSATVWFSYHLFKNEYFAIKIQHKACLNTGLKEVEILRKITEELNEKDTKLRSVKMLENFTYDEPINPKKPKKPRTYVCTVFDVYAGSLAYLTASGIYKYGLPVPVVKRLAIQILESLVVFHEKLNIIITDLKPANILFKGRLPLYNQIIDLFDKSGFMNDFNSMIKEKGDNLDNEFWEDVNKLAIGSMGDISMLEYEYYQEEHEDDEEEDDDLIEEEYEIDYDEDGFDEEDEEVSDEEIDHDRNQSCDDTKEVLEYHKIHNLDLECDYYFDKVLNKREESSDKRVLIDEYYVNNIEIAITDFGRSYFYNERVSSEIQDRKYRAPEIILNIGNYGYKVDVWSFMCVIFEMLTGYELFIPSNKHNLSQDIHHLFLIEKIIGPIPLKMKKESIRRDYLFDNIKKRNRREGDERGDYCIKNVAPFEMFLLEESLVKQFKFSPQEAMEIGEFLRLGLTINPRKRSTAREILNHKWLKQ